MKILVLLLLSFTAAACQAQATANSTMNASSTSRSEAVVVAPNGNASIGRDRVEIRGGNIRVNGVSYGFAPDGAEVRYVRENGQSRVLVNGVPREAETRQNADPRG